MTVKEFKNMLGFIIVDTIELRTSPNVKDWFIYSDLKKFKQDTLYDNRKICEYNAIYIIKNGNNSTALIIWVD